MRYELKIYLPEGKKAGDLDFRNFKNLNLRAYDNLRLGLVANYFNLDIRVVEADGNEMLFNWRNNRLELQRSYVWYSQKIKSNFSCGYDYESSFNMGFSVRDFTKMTIRAFDFEPGEQPVLARRLEHIWAGPNAPDRGQFPHKYEFHSIGDAPIEIKKPVGTEGDYAAYPMQVIVNNPSENPLRGADFDMLKQSFLTRMQGMRVTLRESKDAITADDFSRLSFEQAQRVLTEIRSQIVADNPDNLDLEMQLAQLTSRVSEIVYREPDELEKRAIRKADDFQRRGVKRVTDFSLEQAEMAMRARQKMTRFNKKVAEFNKEEAERRIEAALIAQRKAAQLADKSIQAGSSGLSELPGPSRPVEVRVIQRPIATIRPNLKPKMMPPPSPYFGTGIPSPYEAVNFEPAIVDIDPDDSQALEFMDAFLEVPPIKPFFLQAFMDGSTDDAL